MTQGSEFSFIWKPIHDLPADWKPLASTDLATLAPIWTEQSRRMQSENLLQQFNTRLKREWAIETGIIEGLYSIDRGVTQILIERGIDASLMPHGTTDQPAELIVAILRDHQDALEGLFDFVANRRELSTSYIKEIHAALTRNQPTTTALDQFGRQIEVPLKRGEWKTLPNNPTRDDGTIHQYCPPEQTASEMDKLVKLHLEHTKAGVAPEVEAAWLHHRFTQIHPFQDGNGRVARVLASLIFLRGGWFPLVVTRDQRTQYITALEDADTGKIHNLVQFFGSIQKRSFLSALSLSTRVIETAAPARQVIASAAQLLKARFENRTEEQSSVFNLAKMLEQRVIEKFTGLSNEIRIELKSIKNKYNCFTDYSDNDRSHWFGRDVISVAGELGYFANIRRYSSWARLSIAEERQANIIISIHSIGRDFVGLLGASAFMTFRDTDEESSLASDGPIPLSAEVFQIAYNEQETLLSERFVEWLDKVVLLGLEQWRRQI